MKPVTVPPAHNLPNGKMALRNPKASRSGLAGAIGIDFKWSEGAFEFAGERFQTVGIRYRGNGTYINSLFGSKQSYKVDLNRVKKGQTIGGVTTLNFVNSIPDFSYLKDALAQKLFRELGAVSPRTAYAYLTVDVPGQFTNQALGLFVLIEDIDGIFAKDRFGSKSVPIFKPVTYDLFADWGKDWSAYKEIYDLKTKATAEQLARVPEFAQLVSHASDEDFARKLPEFLDLEEYAAFVAGHVLTSSYDGYLSNGQNYYVYLDPTSNKFGFIPWDQDHGWGEFGYVSKAEKRETASIWKPSAYDNKFLKRVMKVGAFREVYRRKLEQGLAGPFTVERLDREIDVLAAAIRPAIEAESDFRLKRFEIAISTNWVSGPRDGSMNAGTAEGPRAPAHQLKRFIRARMQSVRDQLDGKTEGALIRGFGE
jgi:spore coat protein H